MENYSCPNCNHKFLTQDKFCSNCGQKKLKKEYGVKDLITHFFEDYFSFDNKILKTLKVLFVKPGELTVSFFEGKRSRYVLPLRFYLFVAFISVFSISIIINSSGGASFELEITEGFNEDTDGHYKEFSREKDLGREVGEQIGYVVREKSSIFILLELPIFAFFIYLFFYRKNRYYMEAFVMALHTQTFFFIALLVGFIFDFIIDSDYEIFLSFLIYFIYSIIALKSYYKTSYFSTTIKLFLIQILQVIIILTLMVCYILIIAFFKGII